MISSSEGSAAPLVITAEAAERLSKDANFERQVLTVRHLLGCGGAGFRVAVEEDGAGEEGHRFESRGIPVVMDDYSFQMLRGATLEVDPDPAGDGYRLDHPNAVLTTFC